MQVDLRRRLIPIVVSLAISIPIRAQQTSGSFRWIDFHEPKDQNIVTWVTRSLAVEKWTAIREIGVVYDAALVVTADRAKPQAAPDDDTITVWSVSLTSHVVAPLITGVNLRWFGWLRFADGSPEELTALYNNCRECAASTYFTAFHYDIAHHMWAARWIRGGQGVMVWSANGPTASGVEWTQVYAVMGGARGRALLCTWNHFDYGKERRPSDTVFRYDVDPVSGLERTVELSGDDADAMELRLCRGEDAVEGLGRGQDSALCTKLVGARAQRKPVTTPPANNEGRSTPPGTKH